MARITLDIRADDNASQILAKVNEQQAKLNIETKNGTAANRQAAQQAKNLQQAYLGLAAGTAAVIAGSVAVLQAADKQIKAEARLTGVLRANGSAAQFATGELKAFASSIQAATNVDDVKILDAISTFTSFGNISIDVTKRATQAAVDMGAVFGDVTSATQAIGKALNSPVEGLTALQRVGIRFTDQQKEQIKSLVEQNKLFEAQSIILQEVEGRFSGTGETIADNVSGLQRISNAWSDFMEELGRSQALRSASNVFAGLLETLQKSASLDNTRWSLVDIVSAGLGSVSSRVGSGERFINLPQAQVDALADQLSALDPETVRTLTSRFNRQQKEYIDLLTRNSQTRAAAVEANARLAREAEERALAEEQRLRDQASREREALARSIEAEARFNLKGSKDRTVVDKFGGFAEAEKIRQDAITQATEEGNEERIEAQVNYFDEVVKLYEQNEKAINQIYSQGLDIFNRLFIDSVDQQISVLEKQLEAEKRFYSEQLKLKKDTGQETAQFEQDFANKQLQTEEELERLREEAARRKFERDKVLAIADATIKGAQGFVAALAGGPLGIALASVIAGLTATQIGLIASQQFPGLATGGIVQPQPGGSLFRLAEAGEPEAVIPLSKLGNMGGGVTVNIGTSIGVPTRELMLTIKRELSKLATERVN